MPQKGMFAFHFRDRAVTPAAHLILTACWSRRGCWYLPVLMRQVGVAERWLWVHGLVLDISQRRDKDEVGAGATSSKNHQKREKTRTVELEQLDDI